MVRYANRSRTAVSAFGVLISCVTHISRPVRSTHLTDYGLHILGQETIPRRFSYRILVDNRRGEWISERVTIDRTPIDGRSGFYAVFFEPMNRCYNLRQSSSDTPSGVDGASLLLFDLKFLCLYVLPRSSTSAKNSLHACVRRPNR